MSTNSKMWIHCPLPTLSLCMMIIWSELYHITSHDNCWDTLIPIWHNIVLTSSLPINNDHLPTAGCSQLLGSAQITSDKIWSRFKSIFYHRVATKIFKDFGEKLCKEFIRGRETVSIVHCNRPGTCINCPLH